MKKIYFLALLFGAFALQAQENKEDRYYNSWRFGLNMGGMWQTADVRSTAGVAGGFTLEKGILENKTHFFSLAIRGRGLFGNTYGLDYGRNYNVKNNPALNGTYNPAIRYDSVSANPYIYNNYKTQINEGALELVVNFNRLRERTNILLNVWGGIGITGYRTNINLLDASGKMYNYSKVDSTGGPSSVLASHHDLLDGSYESYGRGSKSKNLITFSPSCGVGLGYKFNRAFSIMFEYKLTFPQGSNADLLDGIIGRNNDWIAGSKDYYHYAGLNLIFRLGGKGKSTSTTNVGNYTPAPTNSIITTHTAVTTNTIDSYTNTQPTIQKPIVNINTPSYSPYNETVNPTFTVFAKVYNVDHRNEVYITANGTEVKNYTWLGRSISFIVPLNVGNNPVSITATNAAGSDSKSVIINYSGVPPQVNITTPGTNQHTTAQSAQDLYATVLNVESAQYINVLFNGNPYSAFTYNPQDKTVFMQLPLQKGTNNVQITATNKFGNDSKIQTILYNPPANTVTATGNVSRSVSVTILDPAVNPFKVYSAAYNVKATVTGVSSAGQVKVTLNNAPIPFNYNAGGVDFNTSLIEGNNTISVSAANGRSSDSKSTVIVYAILKKTVEPPTVVILNPQPSPQNSSQLTYNFKAQVKHVADRNQLEVKYNGVAVSNYNFDASSGIIDFTSNLTQNSNNIFEVKATNVGGSQSANGIVKHQKSGGSELKTKVICHRKNRINFETITIKEEEWPIHQAHGDYEGACSGPNSGPGNLDPDLTICHNENGKKQTIVIKQSQWGTHQSHGDAMGPCPKEQGNVIVDPDIQICHTENGKKQTITIKQSLWAFHQSHGDVMGACPREQGNVIVDPDIQICHIENGKKQTITIKQSQWAFHQSHGDALGACPKEMGNVELDPDISICHQNGDGTQTKMTIKQSQWPTHQAHGDFLGENCVATNTRVPTSLQICHKNQDGSSTTMVIAGNEWATHSAHGDFIGKCPEDKKITICHIPPGNNQNPQTIEISESAWPAHQAHGDTKGACPENNSNPGNGNNNNNPPEDKKITICHIPPGNNQNPQTIEISESAWPAHQAHGDTKGACPENNSNPGNGNNNNNPPEDKKITICHIPPGNNQNPQTIEISESAWPAHQAHGDTKGACAPSNNNNSGNGNNNSNPNPPEDKKITICHIPPGNNQNPQTIEISESAWPAHEAHGDTKGACAQSNNNNSGNGNSNNNPGNGNNNTNPGNGNNSANTGNGSGKGGEKKITICHIPPGNNQNPQTIEISESAWPAHEAHGDYKGSCVQQRIRNEGETKGKNSSNTQEGTTVPGRTNQTQNENQQKAEEPKSIRPR